MRAECTQEWLGTGCRSGHTSALSRFPQRPETHGFHLLVQIECLQQRFNLNTRLSRTNRFGALGDSKRGYGNDGCISFEVSDANFFRRAKRWDKIDHIAGFHINGGDRGDAFHKEVKIVCTWKGTEEVMTGPQDSMGFIASRTPDSMSCLPFSE